MRLVGEESLMSVLETLPRYLTMHLIVRLMIATLTDEQAGNVAVRNTNRMQPNLNLQPKDRLSKKTPIEDLFVSA